jgi:hypothetical protein
VTRPSRFAAWVLASLLAGAGLLASPPARASDDATADARSHYEMGLKLFDAREHEQALIEFARANEIKPRPAAVFMMAQCEYLLGRLKEARAHYKAYVTESPDGEFITLARDRIESIDKRKSTLAINSVPDDVTVRITREGEPGEVVTSGQAPNNFSVPRGRYRLDVTKENYQGQTRIVDVDIAETKPLFFKLEPIPARLEIETRPAGATLYVNGNRARNPYRQDVPPGRIEIFAEAPDHEPKTTDLTLVPGERRLLIGPNAMRLTYRQRSGRPELLVASGIMGALVGGGAVAAAIGPRLDDATVSSFLLVSGGAVAGSIVGALIATPLVPDYIADNRAFFILGGMWIGAAEGAAVGVVAQQVSTASGTGQPPCPYGPCRGPLGDQLRAGFIGSLPGLAVGLTGGALLARKHAPTYGRVALIQSGALIGALSGGLAQVALQWQPYGEGWTYTVRNVTNPTGDPATRPVADPEGKMTGGAACEYQYGSSSMTTPCAFKGSSFLDLVPGTLIGLNVGLAGGLLAAYLPDQSKYGPTWKRVVLVDLAVGAGMIAGGTFGCVANYHCLTNPDSLPADRAVAAGTALAGGVVGLIGGVLLTRHVDDDKADSPSRSTAPMPVATFAPMRDAAGNTSPGFAAMGFF